MKKPCAWFSGGGLAIFLAVPAWAAEPARELVHLEAGKKLLAAGDARGAIKELKRAARQSGEHEVAALVALAEAQFALAFEPEAGKLAGTKAGETVATLGRALQASAAEGFESAPWVVQLDQAVAAFEQATDPTERARKRFVVCSLRPFAKRQAVPAGSESAQTPASATNIEPPRTILMATADYPEQARRARIAGVVEVQLAVDAMGCVTGLKALKSPSELLTEPSLAVMRWSVFEPPRVNGRPDGSVTVNTMRFGLD